MVGVEAVVCGEAKDGGCDEVGVGASSCLDGRDGFVTVGGLAGDVGGFGGGGIVGGNFCPHHLFCHGSVKGLDGAGASEGKVHCGLLVLQF